MKTSLGKRENKKKLNYKTTFRHNDNDERGIIHKKGLKKWKLGKEWKARNKKQKKQKKLFRSNV